MVLLLKLTLVPTLILLVSLAGARWGARVAGMLAGFPIIAGPIVLLLALEQGPQFASNSALATLYGLLALIGYCLTFCWLAQRWSWWRCLLAGWFVFAVIAQGVQMFPAQWPWAASISGIAIALAPRAFPALATTTSPQPVPRVELLWRVLAAAALVLSLTALAQQLGPSWSGVLTPFPVAGSVLGVFALRSGGAAQATTLLRGMVNGLFSLWLFFVMLAALLPHQPLLLCFLVALIAAITMQGLSMRYLLRRARR